MSGIVGIINRDEPVDRQLLERMTAFLSFRGPDAQQVWAERQAGFGHALLQTADDVTLERQPFTLDGRVWITADARIDDRSNLISKLKGAGEATGDQPTDVELILRAYLAWGNECPEYLLGDFAFAIWDGRSERLLCVRDQLGVKPFFYAELKSGLVFSNTLGCIRQHPEASDQLNDQAIADFLLFGFNAELNTTAFADIRRLPPAHALEWTSRGTTIRRYWKMPVRQPLHYQKASDYVEHFSELLHTAVADRLRTNRVGIAMSGGLDSSTIAATAQDVFAKAGRPGDLRAWTTVSDTTIADEERHYAGLVAAALRIPISYQVAESYKLFGLRGHRSVCPPEPRTLLGAARQFDRLTQVARHGRVMLTGQGGDVILRPSASYLLEAARRMSFRQLFDGAWGHYRAYRRLPRLGVRTRLRRWVNARERHPRFPEWIDPGFSVRLKLKSRFAEVYGRRPEAVDHHRPEAYQVLAGPQWSRLFEGYDPEVTGFTVEYRHPLFDIRLVDFALTVPTMPWCVDKALVREAMRGTLPEAVRCRRKTPFAGNPFPSLLEELGSGGQQIEKSPLFLKYVQPNGILPRPAGQDVLAQRQRARPFYLNLWLCSLQSQKSAEGFLTSAIGGE